MLVESLHNIYIDNDYMDQGSRTGLVFHRFHGSYLMHFRLHLNLIPMRMEGQPIPLILKPRRMMIRLLVYLRMRSIVPLALRSRLMLEISIINQNSA